MVLTLSAVPVPFVMDRSGVKGGRMACKWCMQRRQKDKVLLVGVYFEKYYINAIFGFQ